MTGAGAETLNQRDAASVERVDARTEQQRVRCFSGTSQVDVSLL